LKFVATFGSVLGLQVAG